MTSLRLCVRTQLCILFWQSRQTSLPLCVRTQLCILFQQQANVIAIVCPHPNMYTIVVAGRRHYHCVSVPNSVYCSSSRQTSLPIYVRAQLCILFQQQADVITNVYCSSSRQTSLPIYVRTQLCILFQQQADVITNICPYPTLYTVLVAGRRHYQYMFVPNSIYCSSSRQSSLPLYVRTQLCILLQ